MSVQTSEKGQGVIETFITGAKKGWNVAINTIMPAMVLGYVLVQAFNVPGIMTVLGNLCGPVMGLVFGFVEDILGFILHPTGEFFPGYTLSTMAGVLVYALCFFRRRITVVRLIAANLLVNLLVNAAMGSVWSTMVRGGVYWGWFIPSLAKNLVTVLPKAAALYFLFQALLPILQRMGLIPRQVDGAIRLI